MSPCVLVVEDEALVAMLLEDMLADLGYQVGPMAGCLEEAMRLAESETFDVAILDVNLNGQVSYPIAEILTRRGIPFLFATGYGARGIDPAYADATVLQKPFAQSDLGRAMGRALPLRAAES